MADMEFTLNIEEFLRGINGATDAVEAGAKSGMRDVVDLWVRDAVDVAPIDKGTLRRGISGKTEGDGFDTVAVVSANATEKSKRYGRFNYAYFIHEMDAGGRNLRTPGTVKRFLTEPAERSGDKWMRAIESEIKRALAQKGW